MELVDFLREHGVDYREGGSHGHVRPGWVGVDCPYCRGVGKFHAGIREDLRGASCWQCGGLRMWDLIGAVARVPWYEAKARIMPSRGLLRAPQTPGPRSRRFRTPRPSDPGQTPPQTAQNRPDAPSDRLRAPQKPLRRAERLRIPRNLEGVRGPYRGYLRDRGFNPEEIGRLWGIKATGPVGRLAWRLWIPIHDLSGHVVSWTTRAISPQTKPRYLSASPDEEAIPHKQLLYGEHLAGSGVVVVEGPLDVWAVGPGAVGLLGLKYTPAQVARIGEHPSRAICCDSEPAALRRAERLANELQQYPGETHIVELETGSDPADADPDEIQELRERFTLTVIGGNL